MLYQHGKKFYNQYTNDQNHFANWVEHVFDDPELAHSLRNTNDFNKTAKLIDDKLKYAELHIKHNESKEILYNYCRNMQNGKNFEPKFHRFDTLDNHDLSHVQEFLQNQNKDKFEQEMLKLLDYKPKRLSFFDRFFNKK